MEDQFLYIKLIRTQFFEHLINIYNNDIISDPLYYVIYQITIIANIDGNDAPTKPAISRDFVPFLMIYPVDVYRDKTQKITYSFLIFFDALINSEAIAVIYGKICQRL